jgi:hypothetical protein
MITCFIAFACYRVLQCSAWNVLFFVLERAGKKQKRVVLTIKAKVDMCSRLEHDRNYNKLMKEYGVRSLTIYNIQIRTSLVIFDIQEIAISGKPLVPGVRDIADFTVYRFHGVCG